MNNNLNNFAQTILDKNLWWRVEASMPFTDFSFSPALKAKFQLSPDDKESFVNKILPDSQQTFETNLQQMLSTKTFRKRFIAGFSVNNHQFWIMNELHQQEENGKEYIYAVCIDITEMHEISEQLASSHSKIMVEKLKIQEQQSQSEKKIIADQYNKQTQFLAMLSHELRSPLQGVTSIIGVIKSKIRAGQDVSEELKIINLTIEQINFLINDILTYSQTQSEQLQINPVSFSIVELADYVSHLTKSIANEKGIYVKVQVETEREYFYGDLVRISQILINLIVNAIKFTKEGGVTVSLEENKNRLELVVTDSGEGIREEKLSYIFQPFSQISSKVGAQYTGSGLGLTIVKTLVDLLGGSIKVESEEKIGTAFIVSLPILKRDKVDDAFTFKLEDSDDQKIIEKPKLSPWCKVLIADDSVINRKVLRLFLEDAGCQVDEAEDGLQAIEIYKQKKYEYVFLDIQMPKLNGLQVCKKIRKHEDKKAKKAKKTNLKGVFALTAAHTVEELKSLGGEVDKSIFTEWIEKPISEDKVLSVLKNNVCKDTNGMSAKVDSKSEEKEVVESVFSGVSDALKPLIPCFLETVVNEYEAIVDSFLANDEERFKRTVHFLKGEIMLFNLKDLIVLIKKIESADFKKDQKKLSKLLYFLNVNLKKLR